MFQGFQIYFVWNPGLKGIGGPCSSIADLAHMQNWLCCLGLPSNLGFLAKCLESLQHTRTSCVDPVDHSGNFINHCRDAISTGASGAMAPVDFKKFCVGTHEIIIKLHFWARFWSCSWIWYPWIGILTAPLHCFSVLCPFLVDTLRKSKKHNRGVYFPKFLKLFRNNVETFPKFW